MATNLPRQYHFHQTATILQRYHAQPRIYYVNSTFTKLPPFYNVTHGHESTTSIPLSPNCHHFTTSHMATNLPCQYHFHQTDTILQRYHAQPRIYHINSTFTKLPQFTTSHMATNLPRQFTTSIPLSPNCHHFTTSHMATNLPRQFHFHQTATILQRHTWPRIYHVNTTFTKLTPSCNVITHSHEFTTSIPLSPNCHNLQRHTWPRIYHVNSTFTKLPPFYNVTHGHESTMSIPLSPNCHHLATLSRTATNLPRQFHFHQTATILQRHTSPRIYHVNTTFTKLPPSCNVITHSHESTTSIPLSPNCHHFTMSHVATNLPRQYHFHQTATISPHHGDGSSTSMPLSPNCHLVAT